MDFNTGNNYSGIQMSYEQFRLSEILSLTACSLIILWPFLSTWILGFDGAGRIPRILLFFAFSFSFDSIKNTASNKTILLYIVLGAYMFLNGYLKGGQLHYPKDGVYRLFIDALTGPFMLLILVDLFQKHFYKTVKVFIAVLFAYTTLYFHFTDFETHGDFDRLTGLINANEAALHSAVCFMLILLLFAQRKIQLITTVLLAAFPFWVILQTGSRMALVMCLMAVFGAILLRYGRKNRMKAAIMLCVLAAGVVFILDNTMIGARMETTTTQTEEFRYATGTVLDKFGDRGFQYYFSWPYFLEHPITGIGFRKWRLINPLGIVAHSEYMVMYVENGIIGISLFIYIMIHLFKGLICYRRQKNISDSERDAAQYLIVCLMAIMVADTVLWTFNEYGVFIIYAACFVYPTAIKQEQ